MEPQTTQPYGFLNGTFSILHVDDDPDILKSTADIFSKVPIFRFFHASRIAEAIGIIERCRPINGCIYDLGILDKGDELYLLNRYKTEIPFIVLTASESPEIGETGINAGAKKVFQKPMRVSELVSTVCFWATANLLCPDYLTMDNPIVIRLMKALFLSKPENETEWAERSAVSVTYLQKLVKRYLDSQVRHVMFLHRLYTEAFAYQTQGFTGIKIKPDSACLKCDEDYYRKNYRYLSRFYAPNRLKPALAPSKKYPVTD